MLAIVTRPSGASLALSVVRVPSARFMAGPIASLEVASLIQSFVPVFRQYSKPRTVCSHNLIS